jgi:hypothetical protein
LKTDNENEVLPLIDKRTLEKRNETKRKLDLICKSGEDVGEILLSLERFCRLVIESIKHSDYGHTQ